MKKKSPKLHLHRETLSQLGVEPLRRVAGADTQGCPTVTIPCTTYVNPSQNPTCKSLCINCPTIILC